MYELIEVNKPVHSDPYVLLQFKGEIDNTCINEIQKKIDKYVLDLSVPNLVFDLKYLSYVNSQYVGYLISLTEKLLNNKQKLVLSQAQPQVYDIFDNLGVFELIEYQKDLDVFIKSLI